MRRAVVAGAAYFAVVFFAGFLLGTIRVLALEPVLGPVGAGLVELPIILSICWIACREIVMRMSMPALAGRLWVMGAVAFALLMGAEVIVAQSLFGRDFGAILQHWLTPIGAAGLAGQVLYALFPRLQMGWR